MKWAYTIELYRERDDAEPFRTIEGQILKVHLLKGTVFPFENYELAVLKVVKQSQGGETSPGSIGHAKVLVLRDPVQERLDAEEAKRKAAEAALRSEKPEP